MLFSGKSKFVFIAGLVLLISQPLEARAASVTTASPQQIRDWNAIKTSKKPDDFRKYLDESPIGPFSTYAYNHLMHLTSNAALTHDDSAGDEAYRKDVDGIWKFEFNITFSNSAYCGLASFRPLSIGGGILEGQLEHANDTIPFDGHVDRTGKVKFVGTGIFAVIQGQGNFQADRGSGKMNLGSPIASVDCEGTWTAVRIDTGPVQATEARKTESAQPVTSSASQTPSSPSGNSVQERLTTLKKLVDKGLLTETEAAAKRKEILEGL